VHDTDTRAPGDMSDGPRAKALEERLGAVLERTTAAALAVSSAGAGHVHEDLVLALTDILGVDAAVVGEFVDDTRTFMRTRAVRVDGKLLPNFEYDVRKTACRHIVGRDSRHVGSGVNHEFERGSLFHTEGFDSYAGYSLNDSEGRQIGVIVALDRKPIVDPQLTGALLKILAARAAAEIERDRAEATHRVIRLRAEEALRDSEEMYREIFNASADSMVLRDEEFRVVDVNPAYSTMTGYMRAEALGSDRVLSVSAEESEHWRREHRRMLRGEHLRFELRARRKDGTPFETEVHGMPVTYDGRPHVLYVSRDITERKIAEHALRMSEEQYRTIFNVSADVMVVRDEGMRVVDANPAFFALLNTTRNEVIGVRYPLFVGEAHRAAAEALMREALAGRAGKLEVQVTGSDGVARELDVRAMPMQYRGRPHVLSIGRDVSAERGAERERRRLEAQLRQAQKMEAIGQLTGGIAHDFNNILASIMGYNVLALERAVDAGDAKASGYLEEAVTSCRRARDLIQQMLTFSRGQRGERRRLSLCRLVADSTALLRSSLPATIAFDVDCDAAAPMTLADEIQAGQVLLNLCINARDAMQGEGTLTLSVRELRPCGLTCASCRAPVQGRCIALSVSDTGCGIEPAVLERIFEPFFSTKDKGSGMGLSMVHGIVHEHGGHVVVVSAPDRGSTFTVLWPAADGQAEPLRDAAPTGGRRMRPRLHGRVLLVDDEASVRQCLEEILDNWGLAVTSAADGADALDAFDAANGSFDLVITDQSMPRMPGLVLAARLRSRQPGLPVILCSGYTDDGHAAEAARCGVEQLLRKPVEPSDLRVAVESVLARRPTTDSRPG
jgi:PAS domain S-box-containing protein